MNDLRYSNILSFVLTTPWAILPMKLLSILDLVMFRAEGNHHTEEEIQAVVEAAARPTARPQAGNIAILQLYGTIIPRGNPMAESSGATSIERFTQHFRMAMADPSIGGVILDVDSPGGSVAGVDELASEIFRARGTKPMMAIASPMAASAAYWIATAADEMMVTPSGEVGSIGVFAAHNDWSKAFEKQGLKTTLISAGKYKTEGNPYMPLDDEARAAMQERVSDYYGMFTAAVARHRGVSVEDVQGGFGEGRVVGAKKAKKLGMVDHVGTVDDAIALMTRRMKQQQGTRAELITLGEVAEVFDVPEELVAELVIEASTFANVQQRESAALLDLRLRRLKLAGR